MRALLLAGVIALGSAGLARADVTTGNTTFNFTGVCTDCSGTVTGELTLSGYTPGQPISITNANFVSFHYDGSNLLSAFTIAPPFSVASGTVDSNLPGYEDVHAMSQYSSWLHDGYFFDAYTDGSWDVGSLPSEIILDQGANGTFSLASNATAVPEPASIALLGVSLVGLIALRRRRAA